MTLSALYPTPRRIALTLLGSALLAVVWGVASAKARMDMAAMEQRVCRAELMALRARNPMIERYMTPSEPCLALEIVRR